jgi:SAM-dependent methyltransferase
VAKDERRRLQTVYSSYRRNRGVRRRRDPEDPGNRLIGEERDAWWEVRVRRWAEGHPGQIRVLDVGCGPGDRLRWADRVVGPSALTCGVDLLFDQLLRAAGGRGSMVNANAARLPFLDGAFNVAILSTVLSSVPDADLRRKIVSEARRVVRPAGHGRAGLGCGLVLWYDMRLPNPWNREIRPVGRSELRTLFDGDRMEVASITLLPPLARLVARRSPVLARRLSHLRFLRSHYAGCIEVSR